MLCGQKTLEVCTAYEYRGKIMQEFPADLKVLGDCKPVYTTLPGWTEDISGVRKFSDLPQNAQDYLKFIEKESGVPIDIISVGPGREATIVVNRPFK